MVEHFEHVVGEDMAELQVADFRLGSKLAWVSQRRPQIGMLSTECEDLRHLQYTFEFI